jgi:hypothetical protein
MDAAAPEAAEPPETAESKAESRKRWWRRVRFPASIVVTFVGIALTAWLLPAFARQRDDRQKARELKAALVTDMAAATSRALVGGEAIWAKRPVDKARVADDWVRSSLSIEARLRAYFSDALIAAWQIYAWEVDRFVGGGRSQAKAALTSADRSLSNGTHPARLSKDAALAAAQVLNFGRRQGNGVEGPKFDANGRLEKSALAGVEGHLQPYLDTGEDELEPAGLDEVQATVVAFQEELTREVLDAHASGFSTTGRDLVHDLLPG